MNQTKTKYALGRVDAIFNVKENALRAKYTIPGKSLTSKQKVKLIRQGKVKLSSDVTDIDRYSYITRVFDFSKFQTDEKFDERAFDPKYESLLKKYNEIKDEIVLGDEEKALELIKKFQA